MEANNNNNNDSINDFLNEFNKEFEAKETTNYTKLADIPKNTNYKINNIYKIKTKFGEKCAIEISCKILGNELNYTTILPDRFNTMSDVQMNILKGSPDIAFKYGGKNSSGVHVVNFISTK